MTTYTYTVSYIACIVTGILLLQFGKVAGWW